MYTFCNYIHIFYKYNKEFHYTKNKIELTEKLITDFNLLFYGHKIKDL
jgi:hypothetical protein